jgi:hypothetical protein
MSNESWLGFIGLDDGTKYVCPAIAVTLCNKKGTLALIPPGETNGSPVSSMIGFDNYTDALKWLIANDPE